MACCGGQKPITGQLNDLVHQVGHNGGGQAGVMGELRDLINQVGGNETSSNPSSSSRDCPPGCVPMTKPYAQVTITCPPPILAPTRPEPVEPLRLPCPIPCCPAEPEVNADRSRYANFYNNYNEDYHAEGKGSGGCCPCPCPPKGSSEKYCEDYTKKNNVIEECPGCPTGFKPCTMKLSPPPGCDPFGVWCAQVQPCPPKLKKKMNNYYNPKPCTRPCCKHWKPKEGPCVYDDPCKASCFNHPPGLKPSGRFP